MQMAGKAQYQEALGAALLLISSQETLIQHKFKRSLLLQRWVGEMKPAHYAIMVPRALFITKMSLD